MEIGILGLPQSGKSTLFEIMTGVRSREMHGETCVRGWLRCLTPASTAWFRSSNR